MTGTGTIALLATVFSVATWAAPAQQIQVSGTNRTIAVTTSEDAERRADTAIVHVGYQLYAATSQGVNEDAGNTSTAITKALTALGIASDAIESEQQGTGPVQDYGNPPTTPAERAQRKFQAQQSWSVRTGAENASRVLQAAVAAGANQSGAIDWSVADETSLSAEAAGKALKHAQAIAEQMATGLSAKLGPLVYASNQAETLRILPMASRSGQRMEKVVSQANEMQPLSLNAPIVRRSATVSAVFSIQ